MIPTNLPFKLTALPAVDWHHYTCQIVRSIGYQKFHDLGAIFDGSFPPQRNPISQMAPVSEPAGADNAGSDGIDIDIIRTEFQSQRSGVIYYGRLGRTVGMVSGAGR